jgi:hypothetical protein
MGVSGGYYIRSGKVYLGMDSESRDIDWLIPLYNLTQVIN